MKRGVYFTLDAFFATVLVAMAMVLASKYYIAEMDQPQVNYYSQDIINSLSNIKISEVNDTYIKSLISSGEITNLNNSVLEQIGEFYVLNRTEFAQNTSRRIIDGLVPARFGVDILMNDYSIYKRDPSFYLNGDLVSSRRLISGIEYDKPIRGATSKVYLEGIKSKRYSKYLYFGGFTGQGNISANLSFIPLDANISNIELELDVADSFALYFNGMVCRADITPLTSIMVAERWNLTDCEPLLDEGKENTVDIVFSGLLNESYIAGGFLRVDYKTKEPSELFTGYKITYNFPGIEGIVNLYDAFYVPGTITSMKINLHFNSNETSYLTIGGKIIHEWPGQEPDQFYLINNTNLSTVDYLFLASDYGFLSNTTVPIRFASYEVIEESILGGNADVVLVTDISGSMKKTVVDWTLGDASPTCQNFMYEDDTRRTRAAVCLDHELVNTVMNYTGNRIWPVFIEDDSITDYTWRPDNHEEVNNTINSYYNNQGSGYTCLACAINQAYDILSTYSNDSRSKFIVLMTDGVPTHCASGSCASTSVSYGAKTCDGMCDTSGGCGKADVDAACLNCIANPGASNNAYIAAQRAKDDLNVTIFTIGFGPIDDCSLANETLRHIAEIGNGTYQYSRSTDELRMIYRNISYEILERIEQVSQAVFAVGNLSYSDLYHDSYIEIEYEPIAERPAFDEIAIAIEEDKFTTCTPQFTIPQDMRVSDAKVTSYSGEHWTDYLAINNKEVFNLSNFFLNYVRLGDPFFVYVPVNNIVNGTNTLEIITADNPVNKTGCSFNDTIIYTGLITSSVSYASVLPKSEGCTWTVEFEDGTTEVIPVPNDYTGSKTCQYRSLANFSYDGNDSIDTAAFQLFDSLDYDDNGKVFVNFDDLDLVVSAISVQRIPYPWGPAVGEVRVWT